MIADPQSRHARCACGQLDLTCSGEPRRISMCHCLACQQRTGSVFGTQARFGHDQVEVRGSSSAFVRTGDAGSEITLHFCPRCGSTVYWLISSLPDVVMVAVGAFADPSFPAPTVAVYEARRHPWAQMPDLDVEHWD